MYLGGDDTRLFYSYPLEFLQNVTFFSWYKLSALGINGPSQYLAPFLVLVSLLELIIQSKVALNYLAFSFPLVLGYIYFQKAIKELFNLDDKHSIEIYMGSLFYIFSPILIINQMFVFLIAIWLLGLIPIVVYYFLKYLHTSKFIYVYIGSLWCFFLAFALYAVPWLVGFILPVALSLICTSFLFKKREIYFFLKKLIIFSAFIIISQAFWLTGFISTYLSLGQDSFASKFLSQGFVDTFTPTVLSTATGNIFFPLLNLFHRQIPLDFGWKLKEIFINFYDITFVLNFVFVIIFVFGVLNFKKNLDNTNVKLFLTALVALAFSLYLFTVNIGPLKEFFILLGQIPGFTMFRNFYDKFAPGYVIIYASIISLCLIIATSIFKKYRKHLLVVFFIVILVNMIPIKQTVNSPLWTTDNIYKTLIIPEEYFEFMEHLRVNISSTNNFFSFPFGSSSYSIIRDEVSDNHFYVGVSPVKIFSGISDASGHYAFNFTDVANNIDSYIVNKEYKKLREVMYQHNINYVFVTRNLPSEFADTYLFNPDLLAVQNEEFLNSITTEKILSSTHGNYEVYRAKEENSLISSKNVYFKKISQVKFKIYLKNIREDHELSLLDSYHNGWKLFIENNPSIDFCNKPKLNEGTSSTECEEERTLFDLEDLSYSFKKPVFEETQGIVYDYANKWTIDFQYIKDNFSGNYYKQNEDGSIDVELVLYFVPQNYFYFGSIISFAVFVLGGAYLLTRKNEKIKKIK